MVFFADAFADADDAAAKLADFDIVLSMRERTPLPGSLINRLPKLRMLGMTGARNALAGYAGLHGAGNRRCATRKAAATRFGDGGTGAGTVDLRRRADLAVGDDDIRARRVPDGGAGRHRLAGKTLGVIGLGRLGGYMATYCQALRMNVIAWSQNLTAERAAEAALPLVSKDELMATADAIRIHMVLSDRSRGLVGRADIARMKPGAILVNTSRGPLIDEAAMLEALQAGRIVAALDVYDREPLPLDHPLRKAPNTVLMPHLGIA